LLVFGKSMNQTITGNQRLKTYYEKVYGKKLTDLEVNEYQNRIVKLFDLLMEIDQRNKRKKVS